MGMGLEVSVSGRSLRGGSRRPSPLRFRSAGSHLGAGGGRGVLSGDYMVDLVRSRHLSLGLPSARQRRRGDRRGSAAAGTMGILPLIDRGFPPRCGFQGYQGAKGVRVEKPPAVFQPAVRDDAASPCHDNRRRLVLRGMLNCCRMQASHGLRPRTRLGCMHHVCRV
jgi:hypothetical protein